MAKRWFMVSKNQGEGGLFSLFYDESVNAVSERLNGLEQFGRISELSERGLMELVGHYPNVLNEPAANANGPIMLNYDGRIVTIHG